jgi:hypothetical protein
MKIAFWTFLLCLNVACAIVSHIKKNNKTAMLSSFVSALCLDEVIQAIIEG